MQGVPEYSAAFLSLMPSYMCALFRKIMTFLEEVPNTVEIAGMLVFTCRREWWSHAEVLPSLRHLANFFELEDDVPLLLQICC